jgi:hypothetical protein
MFLRLVIHLLIASSILVALPARGGDDPTPQSDSKSGASQACLLENERIAQAIREDPAVSALFKQFAIDPKAHHVYFVAIDHRDKGRLVAYDWKTSGKKTLVRENTKADDLELKVMVRRPDDGLPELLLKRNERVITVLTHTNPPLYTLSKTITLTPLPVDDLAKIINALGGFVNASVGRELPPPPTGATARTASESKMINKSIEAAYKLAKTVNADKDFAVRFLQYSENGIKGPSRPVPYPSIGTTAGNVVKVFGDLRTAREAFAGTFEAEYGCKALYDTAKTALAAVQTPATADAQLALLKATVEASTCQEPGKARLLAILSGQPAPAASNPELSANLNQTPPTPTPNAPQSKPEDRKSLLESFINASDIVMSLAKAADDVLATELTVSQSAADVQALARQPHSFESCEYTDGLIFADSPDQLAFDKLGTVKVTIAGVSPLGVTYNGHASRTGDRSFRLANPIGRRISVAVGGIYTSLREPTYTAVTDPFDDTKKVIAKTGEKKRTGSVALLGTYRWLSDDDAFRPGLQLGTGFGTDPLVFFGGSLDIGNILRIGIGISGQQLKSLRGGQVPLGFGPDGKPLPGASPVKSSDDIRTKQRLVAAPYLSISISLDSLSLFKRP